MVGVRMRLPPNTFCGEMAQPALVKVLTALTVVLFVVLQTCEAQRQAVCYLTISHQESYSTYTRQSYTTYYGCGWWRRCSRTSYRQQSMTRYRTRYSSQSRCCSGYQSCSSRCCPTNSPTSSLTPTATATLKISLVSGSSSSHTTLLTPTRLIATLRTFKLSSVLSSHIKSSPTLTYFNNISTVAVLASSPLLEVIRDRTLQSSYSFVSTDTGPDATTAPLSSGPLLAGVLSVVGILCIAAVIIVIVLIVVIRGRRKTTRTLDNGRVKTHDIQKVPKNKVTTNPNNSTTSTDGPSANNNERTLHNPVYGAPLNLQDGPNSAGSTDDRALYNPIYGSPLSLQAGSNSVPLYNSVNVKDSSLMHVYEGIPSTTPGISTGTYNGRYSPGPYEVPVLQTDRSATPAASVPDTREYSEPSHANPKENGKGHND